MATKTLRQQPERMADAVVVAVVDGPSSGAVVQGPQIVVGRAASAELVLDDPTVSEFHVELKPHRFGVTVRDLGSRNGTLLGRVRIGAVVVPASPDDAFEIELGRSVLRVANVFGTAPPPREAERETFHELRGKDPRTRALFALLDRVAKTELSVLIEGPTGTGKELVARGLHAESSRQGRPFQVLDCAALPATLAESILFGHERGAFTGADQTRPGVFEVADGGTVFLDEIGDLPLDLQPKLLRVLEQRRVTRVGGRAAHPVSFRLVAATWRNLRQMVNEGRFRDDVYHRIAQARVELPALGERRKDIEVLVQHFLRRLPPNVVAARSISREAMAELVTRDYPGNVRELRNVVERAAQMAESAIIAPADLAFDRILERGRSDRERGREDDVELSPFKDARRTVIDDFERDYLLRLRDRADGSLRRAALIAGVQRHYLREVFKKHGIPLPDRNRE